MKLYKFIPDSNKDAYSLTRQGTTTFAYHGNSRSFYLNNTCHSPESFYPSHYFHTLTTILLNEYHGLQLDTDSKKYYVYSYGRKTTDKHGTYTPPSLLKKHQRNTTLFKNLLAHLSSQG